MSRNIKGKAQLVLAYYFMGSGRQRTNAIEYGHEVRSNGFKLMPLKAIGTNLLGSNSIKILEQHYTTIRLHCTAKFDSCTH